MIEILALSSSRRRRLYEQIGQKLGLHPLSVEKDLWVTSVLQVLFTVPYANSLVFKGGSSLSKVWSLISRFSEDIDIAVDRRLFGCEGDITKKQLKKLRKESSLFVKEKLAKDLQNALEEVGLTRFCSIEVQPNGMGDGTYPEPRKIYVVYESAFSDDLHPYLKSSVQLEVGARSLIEPSHKAKVLSIVTAHSTLNTSMVNPDIITAVPEKTFIEKAFLIHELFSTENCKTANRKSRHLYDIECMMDKPFAIDAIRNDLLWENVRHHREIFTSVSGVDYTLDIRKNIILIPPSAMLSEWKDDYKTMQQQMVYGESLPFERLIDRMRELENRFHNR